MGCSSHISYSLEILPQNHMICFEHDLYTLLTHLTSREQLDFSNDVQRCEKHP